VRDWDEDGAATRSQLCWRWLRVGDPVWPKNRNDDMTAWGRSRQRRFTAAISDMGLSSVIVIKQQIT
jgi:hypothetical protein